MASKRVDPPLVQLFGRIRESKHRLSKEEIQVLIKCRNEILQKTVEGAILSFSLTYFVSQSLGLYRRLALCTSITVITGIIKWRTAQRPCIAEILEIEGSPISGELLHILQTDHPKHPALKSFLEKRHKVQVDFDEEGEKGLRRLPPKVDAVVPSDEDQGWGQDRAMEAGSEAQSRADTERLAALARAVIEHKSDRAKNTEGVPTRRGKRREVGEATEPMAQDSEDMGDFLTDPFSFPTFDDDETEQRDSSTDGGVRRPALRKSKMSLEERRDFNRKQYLEWQRRKERQQQQQREAMRNRSSPQALGSSSFLASHWASTAASDLEITADHSPSEGETLSRRDRETGASFQQLWYRLARKVLKEQQVM